ncbi:helix-turn-helix transcriptional regulator [Ilumatobacter nonamiensis]|uniref:helix-turn-helix transcriptional regulator n=1 Tax=Ilumatobacter nonamiensis TaxID=467093 RepID=UPI00034C07D2|nr:LuxR C-terminal-related transcriptional regulator [Ilumatobacter nonamiensis]
MESDRPGAHRPSIVTDRNALVEHVVARLTSQPARSIVLRGPAGIGKSHAAGLILDRLAESSTGVAVRRVHAGSAQQALEFGALLHLLPMDAPPVGAEFELVQRLRRGLVEQATPTVVGVDDVGMLDHKSAAILEGLIRAGDIAVVVTERTGPDGVRNDDHHLSNVLRDKAESIVLGSLDVEPLTDLLVEWAGPGEVGSLHRLAMLSEGNPLALRELLASAHASSAIVERSGLWHLDDFVPSGRSLEQLVATHLDRLSQTEWDLLRTVAIAGAVPRGVLSRLDLEAVERLERSGLVAGDPCVLVHPLYTEVIRGQLVGQETRRLYSKLASAVGPQDGVDPARLAEWMLDSESGIDDRTARVGAAVALGRWENPLAQRLLGAIAEPTAADLVQLVWAHANDGDLGAAQLAADRAIDAAETETERVDAGLARAELWCLQLGRSDDGYEQLAELRRTLDQPDQRARVDGATALYMRMTGKGPLAAASAAAATASDVTSDAARLSVVLADAFDKVFVGSFDAAGAPIVEGYEIAERLSSPHVAVRLGIADALRHLLGGDLRRASEVVDRWLRAADVSLVRPAHAVWLGATAHIASLTGDYQRAVLRGREAVRAADHVDDIGVGGFIRGELRATLIEMGTATDPHRDESPLGGARAELRLASSTDVDALAAERVRRAIDSGYLLWAPWIGLEAIRRGPAPETSPIVIDTACEMDGPLAQAICMHARGIADRDAGELARAVEQFEAAGAHAPALDALLAELETALEQHGSSSGGNVVALRRRALTARALAEGMAPTAPPRATDRLVRICDDLDMPSDRQLEIARLVASGKTSKEVAAELVVSARTVDNHLAAVYRRLGLSGRRELTELSL